MAPTNPGSRPPGMIEVARAAGVSAQTVSRVLAGHPNVSARTRDKVELAVDRLGYRKNSAARALSSGQTHTIGVVLLQTHFYSRTAITVGIEEAATDAGYAVNTATIASLATRQIETALHRLGEQGVDGVIFALPVLQTSPAIEKFAADTPTVTIDGSRTEHSETVAIDQEVIARLATEHLLEMGHRSVWHISGPGEWRDSASRVDGWRATMRKAGIDPPPVLEGDWSPASGYRNGLILGRIADATAVFVSSDEMAFGVIHALHESGKDVPGDLSVVGVDNIELAQYCTPSLTTVAQPFSSVGRHAVDNLLLEVRRRHGGHSPDAVRTTADVRPVLIVRGSTAPPR